MKVAALKQIIYLNDSDFEAVVRNLAKQDPKDRYGMTDTENRIAYIRYTGISMIDEDSLKHEMEHLRGNTLGEPKGRFYFKGGGAPAAPTIPEYNPNKDYKAYIKWAPQVATTQIGLAPRYAESELNLLNQYGPQYAASMKRMEEQLYPYSTGLQEGLAKIASERLTGALPKELQDLYRENLRAEIGPNAGSGIGADYLSRGLVQGQEDYNRYYQNLGASLTGRIPVTAPGQVQPRYTPEGLTMNQQLAAGAQGYGSYVGALSSIYSSQVAAAGQRSGGGGIGAALGLASNIFGGGFCHIAAELFGGWDKPNTNYVRLYLFNEAPNWLFKAYKKYAKAVASVLRAVPALKTLIKPLFLSFAKRGQKYGY